MNARTLQAALRIALIREEFSEREIREAVRLLTEQGSSSTLLAYLAGQDITSVGSKASHRKKKPIDKERSQAVIGLEKKDPEKYHILSQFDHLLRKGDILPELSDVRRLGEQLSKDFSARNSRRDVIDQLMTVLAGLSIEEIEKIVQNVLSSSRKQDSEYQRLANFIITGVATQA